MTEKSSKTDKSIRDLVTQQVREHVIPLNAVIALWTVLDFARSAWPAAGGGGDRATLTLAIEYIDAGSILVLPSRRAPYLELLAKFAAVRTRRDIPPVVLPGRRA